MAGSRGESSHIREAEIALQEMVNKWRWSPRADFPLSEALSDRLFKCGNGLYLITNPKHYGEDPVRAAGWAESDYWARRVWDNPPFSGELVAPPPQWRPPSLNFLHLPKSLAFESILNFERTRVIGPRKAILTDAAHRLTDGAFLYGNLNGADGITYKYGSSTPKPADEPVAIEFELPERKLLLPELT